MTCRGSSGGTPALVSRSLPYVSGITYVCCATSSDSANSSRFYVNAADQTTGPNNPLALTNFRLGYRASSGDYTGTLFGDMMEVVVYNRVLSDSERRQVELYLGNRWLVSAPASLVFTPSSTGVRKSVFLVGAQAQLVFRVKAYTIYGESKLVYTAQAHAVGSGRTSLVFTPRATSDNRARARLILGAGATAFVPVSANHLRLTQLPIEVVRGRYTGATGAVRMTQLVIETVVPFVASGPHVARFAATSLVFRATAARVVGVFAKAATGSLVLTASAARVRARAGPATARLVLTATASGLGTKMAGARLVFSVRAMVAGHPGTKGVATLIFRVRASVRSRPIDFGDDYVGRFQVGSEVPLLVVVRDPRGTPTDPTQATPNARIYDLDTGLFVETVGLARRRKNRPRQVYTLSLRLGTRYVPGRYGILYQAPVGDFLGVFLGLFEVVSGGDPAGVVIATRSPVTTGPVVAHVGSGKLLTGSKPKVS